ncbi:Sodium/glucose cotransporter [Botrimarina colliarenosi]|uniref:Sodium/glucose cotransporter n=1 Tax=Botrimarina colliarenosi TaxID=2528001 RepID=A0A5C6AFE6_9BACT|nr:sodium/solute symporter [Botrimarina colliarenosi]TWT98146.1 Sodium/glucose cotransporter [Botrimarina colliarenosi]
MGFLDIAVFALFIAAVVFVGLWKSRTKAGDGEKSSQDYFLAGRGLTWWLVGFSLIAANISTEQFVGMSGNAASHVGLAIASYEWMAAVTLVVVAFGFLPYFLRAGIYTMPEFLEYRYNSAARLIMAAATVLIYLLLLGAVTYSGALTVKTLGLGYGYDIPLWQPSLFIALIAMIYVVAGGLKASVWADLLQGTALIVGGAIIMWLAFNRLGEAESAATVVNVATGEVAIQQLDPDQGPLERFMELNANRMNMFLPATDNVLPWTALLLGMWIPNFYYWGLNQYITQRTLGSSSLAEGQKGIVFAAYLKLVIPFVVVIPGIIAFNLFHEEMRLGSRGDAAAAIAKYEKANPETQYVTVDQTPDAAMLDAHEGPTFLVAVFPDKAAREAAKTDNPHVLRMTQEDYDGAEPAEFQTFSDTEDHAWKFINPELAVEVEAYNKRVADAASAAGKPTASQALVAYKYDTALGLLLGMIPTNTGLFGFVMAALLGAVISSLAAMLNAASSIFTLDLFQKYLAPTAPQSTIVLTGRIAVVVFAIIACALSPALGDPNISNSIFTIIQESQGLISPGILAVFVVGLLARRCPRWAGTIGLLTSIVCYSGLKVMAPEIQFLNRMAIVFGICVAVMAAATVMAPLKEPITFEAKTDLDLKGSKGAWVAGLIGIGLTLVLYAVFSPLGIAK